uniref:Uncharacterized protein n=1 Tax=Lactuca sativa TaxID=4236 RepID=A0A9R1UG06_LACSA|nr:hypothetical protein LSAT_V11C900486420 [Lactuca sativa]
MFEESSEDDENSSHQNINYSVLEKAGFDVRMITLRKDGCECSTYSNDAHSSSRMITSCVAYFYMSEVLHDIKPDFPEEFKPTKSIRFKDVLDGKVGFDVRMNTLRKDGDIIKHIYMVCNRMSKPKMNPMKRNTIYRVKNCKAKIIMKCIKEMGEYRFYMFQEMSLSYSDKDFIGWSSIMKMGATKAYKLKSTLKGDFEYVRGKVVNYTNLKRDMGSIIGFKDA